MRLSTNFQYQTNIEAISDRSSALQRTQQSIASGTQLTAPSDDPQAAAEAERTRTKLARIELERRTIGYARSILGQADGALSDAVGTLQTAREQLITAGNGVYGASERKAIATQLTGLRQQLLAAANRPDGVGGYLFGGQGSLSAPFVDNGQVTYTAQAGSAQVGSELSMTTSLDGRSTFTDIAPASGSGPNANVFDTLQTAIAQLNDPNADPAALRAAVSGAIDVVDRAIDSTSLRRTEVADQLNRIDAHENELGNMELQDKSYLSSLIDVDLAQAISQMNAQQAAQDAAMKTYQALAKLSMFNYM